jgi:hypothetical protein
MGLELRCTLVIGCDKFAGTAHLDSAALAFRGETKLTIPLSTEKTAVASATGDLTVTYRQGTLTLQLGDRATAEKWALRIRSPKSLIDKLGLKPVSRVAILGVADPDFGKEAAARLSTPAVEKLPSTPRADGFDFIFYPADSEAELEKLAALKLHLSPTGAIWVISLKGKAARVKDIDVMRAGKEAGLVDNKVCGFSATHTALKFVIPVAARK